jgi:phage terminase small subunit
MTDQQKKFADQYCKQHNATKAAISAGYSETSARSQASQLLALDEIALYIEHKLSAISKEAEVDATWVLKRFKTISDRCMQEEPVLDKEGQLTGEYRFDSSGANNATAHLGKIIGVFEKDNEQSKINLSIPAPVIYNTAPPLASNENEIDNV